MTGPTPPPGRSAICAACPCPAMYWHADAAWCEHHYWRGTDLPCPDCSPAEAAS